MRCLKTESGIGALHFDQSRDVLYSGHDNGVLHAWKIHIGKTNAGNGALEHVGEYHGHTGPVTSLALAPIDTGFIFSGSLDRTIIQWKSIQ